LLTTGVVDSWHCRTISAGVVDIGGKFASTAVIETSDKFAAGINGTGGQFAAGVIDPVVYFELRISQ
jgi:hypothetical protein